MRIEDLNIFNIVNKSMVLQHKFKDMKNAQYDKYSTNLYAYYT